MSKIMRVMVRAVLLAALGTGLTSGCMMTGSSSTVNERAISSLTCEQVEQMTTARVLCVPAPDGMLLQTAPGTQLTLYTPDAALTFDSTVYWSAADLLMTVAALDGAAVITADDQTRIISTGSEADLALINAGLRTAGSPSQPRLTNPSVVAALPLGELDRAVGVQASRDDDTTASSAPAPGSSRQQTLTVPATNTPVPGSVQPVPVDGTLPTPLPEATEEVACGPPADWTEVYEVQRGDTLTRIATLYDVTIAELIDANCIDNPDRITPGDEFVVPPAPGINPNAAGTASGDTDAPAASFTAERQSITGGECVTLNWDVSGARLVSFEGDPVERSGDALVCPLATQTYSLLVVYQDGEQVGYTVTVTVNP